MNANFMLFVNLGGFPFFCFLSESLSEWRGKTHPSERGSWAVHLLSHKRSEALTRAQSPLGCQPFDCYLSIQLVEVGPTITHRPGPELCLIWLGFLDCCQIKLAYMFRLLSEKSKSHLFWRSWVHCSTAWQDCASALVCPLVAVDLQSSWRQRILPQWGMLASSSMTSFGSEIIYPVISQNFTLRYINNLTQDLEQNY